MVVFSEHGFLMGINRKTDYKTSSKYVVVELVYCSFGFTSVIIKSEERPQCVYLTILAADSMKPNKLERYLQMKHSEMKNKPKEYFHRKLDKICMQQFC